ncbi:MAG: methyltransferase domain-containing protein [Alphaproteobacteria bacterium]|nr:methyltransferase domain-containing protein [Alphaproteobacteria bacterium]
MLYHDIKGCRVCGGTHLTEVLNLGRHTLSGRFPKQGDPDPLHAPLELVHCHECGLLQLRHTVVQSELYTDHYGYRSGINEAMVRHLTGIKDRAVAMAKPKAGDIVLDIGSNDGTMLKTYATPGLVRIGIDPILGHFRDHYPVDAITVENYFSATTFQTVGNGRKAKVITSIAMFYDLDAPNAFVTDIREILHPEGIWIFELSYMPKMLEQNAFDTICHEHLEYYGLHQVECLISAHGLRIFDVDFNETNGGSFQVCVCHVDGPYPSEQTKIDTVLRNEAEQDFNSLTPYHVFNKGIEAIRERLVEVIRDEKAKGKKIYAYGASTKGNTILQYCGLDNKDIVAAADRNPEKWGCRTPGTGIPIISEEEARNANPDYFLVLPWHFREGFLEREKNFIQKGGHFIFPLPNVEVY